MAQKITIIVGGYTRRNRNGRVCKVKAHKRKQWHVAYKTKNQIVHDVKEYDSKDAARIAARKQKPKVTKEYGKNKTLITPIRVINDKFNKKEG